MFSICRVQCTVTFCAVLARLSYNLKFKTNFLPFPRIQTCCFPLTSPSCRPPQRAVNLLAPVPGHVWRGVLPVALVPLGGGLLRQRPHHRLLLPGALPGHLQTPLRLPPLRPEKGRHRVLPLLDHRYACQHPPPPLHQVGSKNVGFFTFFKIQDQLHPLPLP